MISGPRPISRVGWIVRVATLGTLVALSGCAASVVQSFPERYVLDEPPPGAHMPAMDEIHTSGFFVYVAAENPGPIEPHDEMFDSPIPSEGYGQFFAWGERYGVGVAAFRWASAEDARAGMAQKATSFLCGAGFVPFVSGDVGVHVWANSLNGWDAELAEVAKRVQEKNGDLENLCGG